MRLFHLIKCGIRFFLDPQYRFIYLSGKGTYNKVTDDEYLRRKFYAKLGYNLDLSKPKTFNEKLQWLKLYDRNPEYIKMVDKYEVKKYVASVIGEKYIIPTIASWDNVYDIEWDKLPNQFVLKVTHDSGGVIICKDKNNFDISKTIRILKKSIKRDYYLLHREWPYKDVVRRVIAEEYMSDDGEELTDYKFMCFNGVCKCIFTCNDRHSKDGLKVTFYDTKWNIMPFKRHYKSLRTPEKKPDRLDEMIRLAEILSQGITFVRIDFYVIKKEIFFGEMTFYPGSGFEEFTPFKWDKILGSWIDLSNIKGVQ
ncbi:ATP-grasp fold amidoligase family protein [Lachnoanaerobaculum sp. JCM 36186]|uniref:ATP-grasp fold amidoligase family protein n=1 Tax=Lachnoanaerobaculum sanguinis TaxID=3065809 RepID=UPI002768511D|nr:ATP-grasp fold amidoligase family protein [Lachnoanaerobaculum sp. JCM 36186]GMO02090.1 ATP-grasp fold amidoligase family protein [Lachnoanaerobaculum sp. JCM 36186]